MNPNLTSFWSTVMSCPLPSACLHAEVLRALKQKCNKDGTVCLSQEKQINKPTSLHQVSAFISNEMPYSGGPDRGNSLGNKLRGEGGEVKRRGEGGGDGEKGERTDPLSPPISSVC